MDDAIKRRPESAEKVGGPPEDAARIRDDFCPYELSSGQHVKNFTTTSRFACYKPAGLSKLLQPNLCKSALWALLSMQSLHFISGLLCSGSTLLPVPLRQNPRFHAHMSSPVAGFAYNRLVGMSANNEFSILTTDRQCKRILKGVFEHHYSDESATEVVFDTNRNGCARMPLLQSLIPGSEIIVYVRDVGWIMDSIEQFICKNVYSPSFIFNYKAGGIRNSTAMAFWLFELAVAAIQACRSRIFGKFRSPHLIKYLESHNETSPRNEDDPEAHAIDDGVHGHCQKCTGANHEWRQRIERNGFFQHGGTLQ
ncbi:MAG: hypothetical protein QM739_17235 [Propionivibrio sp.]